MSSTVFIRQIQAEEGPALRDIRLRAIRDTPEAFAVSLAETLAETDEGWTAWATLSAAGQTHVMYVAEDAGRVVGMAGGALNTGPPSDLGELISMWVEPAYRGRGLGQRLLDQVVGWARKRDLQRLSLWVTVNNRAAIRLYTYSGFRETGETQPLPWNPSQTLLRMDRDL